MNGNEYFHSACDISWPVSMISSSCISDDIIETGQMHSICTMKVCILSSYLFPPFIEINPPSLAYGIRYNRGRCSHFHVVEPLEFMCFLRVFPLVFLLLMCGRRGYRRNVFLEWCGVLDFVFFIIYLFIYFLVSPLGAIFSIWPEPNYLRVCFMIWYIEMDTRMIPAYFAIEFRLRLRPLSRN